MNFSKSILAIAGIALLASCGQSTDTTSSTTTTTTTSTTDSVDSAEGLAYNDVQTYTTPGGEDNVRFVMTTDGAGTVKTLEATLVEGHDISKGFIEKFSEGAQTQIVGKKIADLGNISAVGGASLTTDAFKKFVANKQ